MDIHNKVAIPADIADSIRAGSASGEVEFKAMQRKIDRIDNSYRD